MKIFTRLFFCLTLVWGATAVAQPYDLAVADVNTAASANNEIPANFESRISLTIENAGANDIPTGTLFSVGITVGAAVVVTDTLQLAQDLVAGTNFVLYSTAEYFFDAAVPQPMICGSALMIGVPDEDSLNNATCKTYQVTTAVTHDMQAVNVVVVSPDNLDGFDIDNGNETPPQLDTVNAFFRNDGDIILPVGYTLSYELNLGSQSTAVVGTLQATLSPGQSTTRNIFNPQVLQNINIPSSVGTYNLCVKVTEDLDVDSTNDESCFEFEIIDSFDPSDPKNWPTGLAEVEENGLKVFFANGFVNVEGVQSQTEVQVMDITGKVVASDVLSRDGRLALDNASGIYVIHVRDAENNVRTERISVQN